MKTAISIPDPVFERAEGFARRRRISRSALFTAAVSEYMAQHRDDDVTERLNQVYGQEDSTLDPQITELQFRSLDEEQW